MNGQATDFLQRKQQELAWKLAGLPDELKQWRDLSAERNALEKNHSQISRLSHRIQGLQALVTNEFNEAAERGDLWRLAENLEKKVLIIHAVWDQFRGLLSLRLSPPFDTYLALADAYARECYVPVYRELRRIASDQLCPAPLITFDQEVSPWMKPEATVRQADANGDGLLTFQQFQDALDKLPLTLLGLPWSYVTYLPHMALLAHEVGHAIERNAALTGQLDHAIEQMPIDDARRQPAWRAWRKEVFADWYGCAMGGPAFAWSMIDYFANERGKIAGQTRPYKNGSWSEYPTATVRVLFACQALRSMGFAAEAQSLAESWSQAYPDNPLGDFSRDFEAVVNAFLGVLDLRKPEYQGFMRPAMNISSEIARTCLAGGALQPNEPKPARAYVMAARLIAQTPPINGAVLELWRQLRQHHLETRPPGVAGDPRPGAAAIAEDDEAAEIKSLADILFADL